MRILPTVMWLLLMSNLTLAADPVAKLDSLKLLLLEENAQAAQTLASQCVEPGFESHEGFERSDPDSAKKAFAAATQDVDSYDEEDAAE